MSGYDARTLAFYAPKRGLFGIGPVGRVAPYRWLPRPAAPGAEILELGCGGGRDAAHMIARGFAVDPTDGVAEIAAKAEAGVEAVYREAARWDWLNLAEGLGGGYDGVQGPWVQITVRRPL